jgi:hypothetical protein
MKWAAWHIPPFDKKDIQSAIKRAIKRQNPILKASRTFQEI